MVEWIEGFVGLGGEPGVVRVDGHSLVSCIGVRSFAEIFPANGVTIAIRSICVRAVFRATTHALTGVVATSSILVIDRAARALLDDIDVIGEVVFSDGLLSAPLTIGKQLIDVVAGVAKRLIVLFGKPIGDIIRECRRWRRWCH
nr:hypothetical protein [Saliphagus sp. LR7]